MTAATTRVLVTYPGYWCNGRKCPATPAVISKVDCYWIETDRGMFGIPAIYCREINKDA